MKSKEWLKAQAEQSNGNALPMMFVDSRGCWIWTRGLTAKRYGQMYDGRSNRMAHVVIWEEFNGPVPAGLCLDHLCRVRSCVNPAHLEAVTMRENIMRGAGLCAENAVKTHCPKGHEYDRICPGPFGRKYRACRQCRRESDRRRRCSGGESWLRSGCRSRLKRPSTRLSR